MKAKRVVWAMCGSFCTFEKTLGVMEAMVHSGVEVLPLMSFNAAGLDTRFGTAESWKKKVEAVTGRKPIETLQGAEPLGPQNMADAMVIAPCTGATLAKLAAGISDTPVTLGAKSMLRGAKPLVLAVSTNDGLAAAPMEAVDGLLESTDVAVNTVPAPVLGAQRLKQLPKDALVIDLASLPGGTDFEAAKELGVRAIHALSLPARCAPVTAGQFVAQAVLAMLRERGEGI